MSGLGRSPGRSRGASGSALYSDSAQSSHGFLPGPATRKRRGQGSRGGGGELSLAGGAQVLLVLLLCGGALYALNVSMKAKSAAASAMLGEKAPPSLPMKHPAAPLGRV